MLVDNSFPLETVERMVTFLYTGKHLITRPVNDGKTPKPVIASSTIATEPKTSSGCKHFISLRHKLSITSSVECNLCNSSSFLFQSTQCRR